MRDDLSEIQSNFCDSIHFDKATQKNTNIITVMNLRNSSEKIYIDRMNRYIAL